VVEQLLLEPIANQAVLSDNLKKVYHGKDGNPDKLAVRGLSLAIPKGSVLECLARMELGKHPSSVWYINIAYYFDFFLTNLGVIMHSSAIYFPCR
jgi:hypothetical protein